MFKLNLSNILSRNKKECVPNFTKAENENNLNSVTTTNNFIQNEEEELKIGKVFAIHENEENKNEISFVDVTNQVVENSDSESSFTPFVDELLINPINEKISGNETLDNDIKITLLYNNTIEQLCKECYLPQNCKFIINKNSKILYICGDKCLTQYTTREKINNTSKIINIHSITKASTENLEEENNDNFELHFKTLIRKCVECYRALGDPRYNFDVIDWGDLEFCDEECLEQFLNRKCSNCSSCKKEILKTIIGKYSVRFGHIMQHFCSNICLNKLKTMIKLCNYCSEDMSNCDQIISAIFNGKFQEFCSAFCLDKYDIFINRNSKNVIEFGICIICKGEKQLMITYDKFETIIKFCGVSCFDSYVHMTKSNTLKCVNCFNYFCKENGTKYSFFLHSSFQHFCSKVCKNIFILKTRKIDQCNWCKATKYDYDMIRKVINDQGVITCSLFCLQMYHNSLDNFNNDNPICASCEEVLQAKFHLTLSNSTLKSFCSRKCVDKFMEKISDIQNHYSNNSRTTNVINTNQIVSIPSNFSLNNNQNIPNAISNINTCTQNILPQNNITKQMRSLNVAPIRTIMPANNLSQNPNMRNIENTNTKNRNIIMVPINNLNPGKLPQILINQKLKLVQPHNFYALNNNRSTNHIVYTENNSNTTNLTRQIMLTPKPHPKMKNKSISCKPITYDKSFSTDDNNLDKSTQTEYFSHIIPVPVPIYVPTPLPVGKIPVPIVVPISIPVPVPIFLPIEKNLADNICKEIAKIKEIIPNDPLEAEMIQMAGMQKNKEINITEKPNKNVEKIETSSEILWELINNYNVQSNVVDLDKDDTPLAERKIHKATKIKQSKKDFKSEFQKYYLAAEMLGQKKNNLEKSLKKENVYDNINNQKRNSKRLCKNNNDTKNCKKLNIQQKGSSLNTIYGINAWYFWLQRKYSETNLENKNILDLSPDKRCQLLCEFVKEIRKPSGVEYYPDTIYYLCLCIQKYLFENGKNDNIFVDDYYKNFILAFDTTSSTFAMLHANTKFVVTRVEEEYLWESKQLGVYSPKVLLTTLIYYNTIYFKLNTIEKHLELSFGRLVKHCNKNQHSSHTLRYYPPNNLTSKKKYFEIVENKADFSRCPVTLIEFYISKCPDCVKKDEKVFYMIPEKYCVPDSPVWFSSEPMGKEELEIILKRIKMIKEVNMVSF